MSDGPAHPHIPILCSVIAEALVPDVARPMRVIDGTLGFGGHAEALLRRNPALELLGIDRDAEALRYARTRLAFAGDRVFFTRGHFAQMRDYAQAVGWEQVDGILLDIGISSFQIDSADRGFSFRAEGPLDMRMDDRNPVTADRILNTAPESELARIFAEYGEIREARMFAKKCVARRTERPFETTTDFAEFCRENLRRPRPGMLPTPTLAFQALRIAVNGELEQLDAVLPEAIDLLAPKGRLAVLSFHSLEDRRVKQCFAEHATACICPPRLPVCCCNHHAVIRRVTHKAVMPDADEIKQNPRAACAKLRVAEKLPLLSPSTPQRPN